MSNESPLATFLPKDMLPQLAFGLVLGVAILGALIALAAGIHLSMSLQFGIPAH